MTKIESMTFSTEDAAACLGVPVPTVYNWRAAGLLAHLSQGRGRPAGHRLPELLAVWLCCALIRSGARAFEAANVANHTDFLGPLLAVGEGEVARIGVFFRNGQPSLSGDPVGDPVLLLPIAQAVNETVEFIASRIAAAEGEEAADAARAEFWDAVRAKRDERRLLRDFVAFMQ